MGSKLTKMANEKKEWTLYGKCNYTGRPITRISNGTIRSAKAMANRMSPDYRINKIVADDGETYVKRSAYMNLEKPWDQM